MNRRRDAFGRVLTSPSLATGATNEGERSSVQSPATQEIVREELPLAEGILIRAVLSALGGRSQALSVSSLAPLARPTAKRDPLPASLIFGDSTEPRTSTPSQH